MSDFKCEKCEVSGWLPRMTEGDLYRCQGCGTLLTFLLPSVVVYRGVQTHDPYCPPCDCAECIQAQTPSQNEEVSQ